MVHLPHLGKLRREVKEEVVDADGLAEAAAAEASPFHKRSRLAQQQQQQQWSTSGTTRVSNQQSSQHDFLDEPSPLGLRLKKSPSLVDFIQMKLDQASKATDARQTSNTGASEKLKASNFPGSVLRIGSWEWVSRYEGDLVAKCYFAKHKLVWEVLDGGLKSKIEIQWSDICGLKMFCPENEPGTLEIALSRPPLFFRETNPQPRKHTLWQATSDFTGGQASMHRLHFLQCPPGMMNKHVEKLVHCDPRLYSLSQQSDVTLENPYFESKCSIFDDPEDMKCHKFEHRDDDGQLGPQRSNELLSPQSAAGGIDGEARQQVGTSDVLPRHLPSSVAGTRMIKQDAASVECEPHPSIFSCNGFRMPGIRRSMSKSEIANYMGHQMYKQMYSGNVPATNASTGSSGKPTLDELTRYLLSDSQITDNGDGSSSRLSFDELTRQHLNDSHISDGADERMLMSRVNSLCCLIQKDSGLSQANPGVSGVNEMIERKPQINTPLVQGDAGNGLLAPRQESIGDLLTNLPRISSFPHFL
uniref:TRF2/HOY1 PH-like domain-containing protein n=1 Tax=Arundo donax TaxID=35708 RepID=A0A0A9GK07_ARUDO